jgi:hypothetical protein
MAWLSGIDLRVAVYPKRTTVWEMPMTPLTRRAEKSGDQFSWREFTTIKLSRNPTVRERAYENR